MKVSGECKWQDSTWTTILLPNVFFNLFNVLYLYWLALSIDKHNESLLNKMLVSVCYKTSRIGTGNVSIDTSRALTANQLQTCPPRFWTWHKHITTNKNTFLKSFCRRYFISQSTKTCFQQQQNWRMRSALFQPLCLSASLLFF